jgi:uncharacterized repeat protein (TIGR01451 family)
MVLAGGGPRRSGLAKQQLEEDMIIERRSNMFQLGLTILGGILLLIAALLAIRSNASVAQASATDLAPNLGASIKSLPPPLPPRQDITATHVISPPEGYPKLSLSTKTVTPNLASTEGVTLYYTIEIRNTGAWTATSATLTDVIPGNTTYNFDAQASDGPVFSDTSMVWWMGEVGFDSSVVLSFSVSVDPGFSGIVSNTAVISDPLMTEPVTKTAETIVTDRPILSIQKTSAPAKPGPNKSLTYTLTILNYGQPATNLPITVTDQVPLSTSLSYVGPDGTTNSISDVVTFTRDINLDTGQTTQFTFSVRANVTAGTVITNEVYKVESSETGVTYGDPYTVTIVDPKFRLFKEIWPDPPGSNREMTYTLTLLNEGSLATDLVITDRVPIALGVTYARGGSLQPGGVVSWTWPSLNTGETAQFTFTVDITDVAEVTIVNDDYRVCSEEGICQIGTPLTSVVKGPNFEAVVILDPIAKKPGGGSDPSVLVTPTLVVRNLGPGNAISATAMLEFRRISVSANDLYADPAIGTPPPFPDINCGPKCIIYVWQGDLEHGQVITFTTTQGQSSVGAEGEFYTATVVIIDSLSNMTTEPVTGTATGRITQKADLLPIKSAPPVIGPGQLLTYTIDIVNTGLATDEPPFPWLTDAVPLSTTFVSASDGGVTQTLTNTTIVSWTLPAMATGGRLERSFTVRVDKDLISGTQIINNDYRAYWYEEEVGAVFSNTGRSVTTTVREVGLIDSYKEVTPTAVLPGGVLTYYVHIVNSSGLSLTDVTVEDLLPWPISTYQRDPITSSGTITEHDIVSIHWIGDVDAYSSETITFSVVIDPDYTGPLTNTAIISHSDLLAEIRRYAGAYVKDKPDLHITKEAPYSVEVGAEIPYVIKVVNLGQEAEGLLVSDTIPADAEYVAGSATAGVQVIGDQMQWFIQKLGPGESRTFEFQVSVTGTIKVINDQYRVTSLSNEDVFDIGEAVVTYIGGGSGGIPGDVYLPIILKNY